MMLAVALVAAVAAAPLGASVRSCIIYDTPLEKSCQPGSCANKKCCATSPKKTTPTSQPLAKSSTTPELNATVVAVSVGIVPRVAEHQSISADICSCSALSPPRLALLCTFLI
jgi:hypothetical protein